MESHPDQLSLPASCQPTRVYNSSLMLAFWANVFQLIAVSLLFRYSDFVQALGGTEWHLGWIVGIASVGAILFRLVQGQAIDRWGPASVWILSLVGEIASVLWHLNIESIDGFQVYAARMLFMLSMAGTFGAWLSFISLQAPHERVAEVIGVIGASGFVGMAIGPTIGDWLFQTYLTPTEQIVSMFGSAAISLTISLLMAMTACLLARRHRSIQRSSDRGNWQNPLKLIWQAHPGFILVVGMLMGLGISFPATYLRPMAEALDIEQIKSYFIVYNVGAFVSRLLFRRAPQFLGLRLTILVGLGFMAVSMLLYLPLKSASGFWIPATAGGLAHSFLFPSVIAACTERFPTSQRGTAINLILAMYDLGVLVGMPIIGAVVTHSRSIGQPPYPTALKLLFATVSVVAVMYYVSDSLRQRRQKSVEPTPTRATAGS